MEHPVDEPPLLRVHDAEQAVLERLRTLGHVGVLSARHGGADDGMRFMGGEAVLHLSLDARPVDVATLQRVAGLAAVEGIPGYAFATGGFSDEAIIWADLAGIGLYAMLALPGHETPATQPVGLHATTGAAEALTSSARLVPAESADPLDVAALLVDGMLGGPVTWVGIWDHDAGLVAELWPEPGDRTTPMAVTVELASSVLVIPVTALSREWESQQRQVPGSTAEQVWVRRCVHANQPPRVLAGEVVALVVGILEACDVDFTACRVEVRETPGAHDDAAVEALVPDPVLGSAQVWEGVAPTDPATPAKVAATLVERARESDQAVVDGLDARGHVAWRIGARTSRLGSGRWLAEARLPSDALTADEVHHWPRRTTATVGSVEWSRDGDDWRMRASGPSAEVAAQQVVAALAAAYAAMGSALERTSIRP